MSSSTPLTTGQTQTTTSVVPMLPSSGQEVYDMIMQEIEPDLVTDQIELMGEKYKDETPEQKKARGERYQKAFAEYDVRYAQYLTEQQTTVHSFKRNLIASVEKNSSDDDQAKIDSLESAFSTAA